MNLIRIFIIAVMVTVGISSHCTTLKFNPQLIKAAENGNMHAMIALAKFSLQHGQSRSDSIAALEWYKRIYTSGAENVAPLISQLAEKLNFPDVQFQYARDGQLAMCHLYGTGTDPNPAEAVKIFEATPVNLISWSGSDRCMYVNHVIYFEDWMLARILASNGKKIVDDELTARLSDQARAGNAEAMWKLAVVKGIDSSEGIDFLVKASENKSDTANMALLNRYLSLRPDHPSAKCYPPLTKQSADKIFKSVSKLCKQNNVMANILAVYFEYSFYYKETLFGPYYEFDKWGKLRNKAMKFLAERTSYHQLFSRILEGPKNSFICDQANNGNIYYQWEMADLTGSHLWDKGLDCYRHNPESNRYWTIKAADNGAAELYYDAGYFYESDGDTEKASRYYLNSVSTGNLGRSNDKFSYSGNGFRAACRLALFYDTGAVAGKPDWERTFEICFSTSALYGRHSADGHFVDELAPSTDDPISLMYKIAECYDFGKGVDENPRKALWWYQKVFGLLSHTSANRLSPEATKFARERVAELKKDYEPEEDVLFVIE